MQKLLCLTLVALTIVFNCPTTNAFIVKTVSVQGLPSLPSPDAALSTLTATKNALVQQLGTVVTEQVNTLRNLVSSIVQAKINAKTQLLRSVTNAAGGLSTSLSNSLPNPLFTKTITVGIKPLFSASTTQSATQAAPTTTTAGAEVTTTIGSSSGSSSGGYARFVRRY